MTRLIPLQPHAEWHRARSGNTIARAVSADIRLARLVQCLVRTGLMDELGQHAQLTLLAPVDEAFERLPADVVAGWMAEETIEQLFDVCEYHVLRGVHRFNTDGEYSTVEGRPISVRWGEQILVNEQARIVETIQCDNGLIHALDRVLTPWATPVAPTDARFPDQNMRWLV